MADGGTLGCAIKTVKIEKDSLADIASREWIEKNVGPRGDGDDLTMYFVYNEPKN